VRFRSIGKRSTRIPVGSNHFSQQASSRGNAIRTHFPPYANGNMPMTRGGVNAASLALHGDVRGEPCLHAPAR
jgi:hypothetical protein